LSTRCSAVRVSNFDVVDSSIALRRNDRSTCANLDRLFESSEISFLSVISRCSAVRVLDFCKSSNFLQVIESTQNDICFRSSHQSTRLRRVVIFIVIAITRIISEKELFWTRKWVYYSVDQEMKIVKSSRYELVSHVSRWFREMNRTKLQDNNKRCSEITTQLFT
jgi:hypothetical protein